MVVGCGHPFRAPGHVPELPEEQLRRLKFLDLTARTWPWTRRAPSGSPTPLGRRLDIPWCPAATPTRRCSTAASPPCLSGSATPSPALYEEMREGRYAIRLADTAPFQVRTACLLKRSLKEIHALGGDYVSILTQGAAV